MSAGSPPESDPLIHHVSDTSRVASQSQRIKQNEVHVKRSRMPIFLILLGKSRILATTYGVMLAQTLITSFDGVLPISVQQMFGWGSTGAGRMFLTVSVPTLAVPLIGMLSDGHGLRWVAAAGFILASVMLALLPLGTRHSIGKIVLLCVLLTVLAKFVRLEDLCSLRELIAGFAFLLTIPPLAADLACAIEHITEENPKNGGEAEAYGRAFSLLNCGISAGVLAGPSLAGFLHDTFGWRVIGCTLAVLSASPVLLLVSLLIFHRSCVVAALLMARLC